MITPYVFDVDLPSSMFVGLDEVNQYFVLLEGSTEVGRVHEVDEIGFHRYDYSLLETHDGVTARHWYGDEDTVEGALEGLLQHIAEARP